MSFILETTDMDLGDTPIENIFINDYMPMANGTYVKVYLLGYKYAHDRDGDISVNNETLAKNLDIPLGDVLRAWDFWEKLGIIEKIKTETEDKLNYQIRFLNLKQLYIKNNIYLFQDEKEVKLPKVSSEDLLKANRSKAINSMFNNIDDILKRQTVPVEKQRILSWINDYNMNPDVIEKACSYSVEKKGIRRLQYIEAIIRNWYDKGLTNMESLMEEFQNMDEAYYRQYKIMKSLGLHGRPIRDDEKRMIDTWFYEYKFTMDIILNACSRDKNPTPSVNYVNGILKSWHTKGIKSLEDVDTMDIKPEKQKEDKRANRKPKPTVTRFHNFQQRTDKYSEEELEKIARKKRDAYRQRAKGEA